MLDLLIEHAAVVDGTGSDRVFRNVGIENGKFVLPEGEADARRVVDGTGLIAAPGFIDAHSHGDLVAGNDYARLCKSSQGITTEVAGMCGSSCFPVNDGSRELLISNSLMLGENERAHMGEFGSFDGFAKFLNAQPLSANMLLFMGHSALRMAVMGNSPEKPSAAQLDKMKALLREGMEHGSAGLSTGLFYPPSGFADVDELSALCEVVAEYGGIHTSHIRNEGSGILASIREVLEVSKRSGAALNISHHKICGQKSWGLSEESLRLMEQARQDGYRVTMDAYPYTASMTKLNACIPTEYFSNGTAWLSEALKSRNLREEIRGKMKTMEDGRYLQCGGFSGVLISGCPSRPEADGKFLADYAAETGQDEFDVYFDLVSENGSLCSAIYFSMSEDDLERIISDPHCAVGTDGLTISLDGKTHPRSWGSFPRVLKRYVREKKLLSLEEAVRKMTSLPAEIYHLDHKGRIADGYDADLVLFDGNTVGDEADFVSSTRLCSGVSQVLVGGEVVYRDRGMTGRCPGLWVPYRNPDRAADRRRRQER